MPTEKSLYTIRVHLEDRQAKVIATGTRTDEYGYLELFDVGERVAVFAPGKWLYYTSEPKADDSATGLSKDNSSLKVFSSAS